MSKAEPFSYFGASHFLTTRWSVVHDAAGDVEQSATQRAREALCRAYWRPVVALLASRGLQWADAEDVAQDFFHKLLAGDALSRVSAEGGRFRLWLRRTVENFRIDAHRHRNAAKRGGGTATMPIMEEHDFLPSGRGTQVREFDRDWADAMVDAAVNALRERYAEEGQEDAFRLLVSSALPGGSVVSGKGLAERMNATEPTARRALERFRRRFRDAVHAQVALTVSDPAMVEDELRYLRSILNG